MPQYHRPKLPPQMALLVLLYAVPASASYASNRPLYLLERQSTCSAGSARCQNAALPNNFCCPSTDSCVALAGNTTALCCPAGSDCSTIFPITCNITFQNAATHPESVVKTTVLDGELPTCGEGCCPFGFTCNSKSECIMDADQSKPPTQSASPSSSIPTATSTASKSPSAPSTSAGVSTGVAASSSTSASPTTTAIPSTDSGDEGPGDGVRNASIIGGAVGGVMLLIVICAGIFVCYRRRKNSDGGSGGTAGGASGSGITAYGNSISGPIPSDNAAMRTDFNRKGSGSAASSFRDSLKGRRLPVSPMSSRGSWRGYGDESDRYAFAKAGAAGYSPPRPPPPPPATGRSLTGQTAPQIPPLRGMRTSNGSSIGGGGGGGGYGSHLNPPRTPPRQRQPSTESINIWADPSTVGSNRDRYDYDDDDDDDNDISRRELDDRRKTNQTTFTSLLQAADLGDMRHGGPYVPPGAYSTPDRRR